MTCTPKDLSSRQWLSDDAFTWNRRIAGDRSAFPEPRVHPPGLGQKQTAEVERANHVLVPHPMPVLLAMVMVAHIVLELGLGVCDASATHRPFCCAPRAVHTEAATVGCVYCVALGLRSWWSSMLGACLAWVVDWVAVHVELGRAELVRPHAHSLLAAHRYVKERLGWTFDVALCPIKDIG